MTQTYRPIRWNGQIIDRCTCADDNDWCAYCELTERAITACRDAREQ